MSEVSAAALADAMYALVKECHGKRQLKPLDLTKAMMEKFGEACDKAMCKEAIRILIEDERCTYSYIGGSYIVLPPEK
jgi:hypothetical protein